MRLNHCGLLFVVSKAICDFNKQEIIFIFFYKKS